MKRIEILVEDDNLQKVLDAVIETGVAVGILTIDAEVGLEDVEDAESEEEEVSDAA